MDFKIDTKDAFAVIIPITRKLDANLAEELVNKCNEVRLNGSNNLIVDLQHVDEVDEPALNKFVQLHEDSYSSEQSLVFTGINTNVVAALKKNETDLLLNVAPKMIEAVDIISMEILERDLFGEE